MHCRHCVRCRWCLNRGWRKEMFKVKDGPSEYWFCDADCSAKFVKYRHIIGTAHILRMDIVMRNEYLKGMTLDDYISNGMKRQNAITEGGDAPARHCNVHSSRVPV